MAFRIGLAILVVVLAALAMVALSTKYDLEYGRGTNDGHGLIADSLDLDEILMMESESARRQLRGRRGGHIGYAGLHRNRVPCNRRGQSYYNCGRQKNVNPYSRTCTRMGYCSRNNR